MNEDYRKRLTEFLKLYIEVEPVGMQNGIMTERAIKQCGIIIPELLQEVEN